MVTQPPIPGLHTTRRRPHRRGFALLDVIVAGLIIGVSLAAIIGLTGRAISSQSQGEDLQTAALLADEQLNLVLARGPDNYGSAFSLQGECDPPFSRFIYQLSIVGGNSSTPYRVTATISWSSTSGAMRSVSLETLIASREGEDPDPDRQPSEKPSRLQ